MWILFCFEMKRFLANVFNYNIQRSPRDQEKYGMQFFQPKRHGPLARYVKLRVAHASGMSGTFSPSPRVGDPDMHHGTCVTHVPWCMPGSLTSGFLWSRRRGKTFPAFPAHAQPAILRIWQEAHDWMSYQNGSLLARTWLNLCNCCSPIK